MEKLLSQFNEWFATPATLWAESPGRIEFIGNHTDYNGGDVLGMALDRRIKVLAAPLPGGRLRFRSDDASAAFEGSLDELKPQRGSVSWANYPLGILATLKQHGFPLSSGFALFYSSDLPSGAGLSSSAAIELATLEAVLMLENIVLEPLQKVLLCQQAENEFVGVPCGMLDQSVSCFGKLDHLVKIDCAKTEVSRIRIPSDWRFWLFNTQKKHSLVDSLYAQRHQECRTALQLIQVADPSVRHLAHAPMAALDLLPADGCLRDRARHVIEEQLRVQAAIHALQTGDTDVIGKLLFQSHASSRDLFDNSIKELDSIVAFLQDCACPAVLGARLTGGGFGGAVMAMTTDGFCPQALCRHYQSRFPDALPLAVIRVGTGNGTSGAFVPSLPPPR